MKTPRMQAEASNALGNISSEGIWNQLGRPDLDRLELLLRESVQNSWDARARDSIDYTLAARTLSEEQRDAMSRFFRETPPDAAYATPGGISEAIEPLRAWLDGGRTRVLLVSDRGTKGLGGPTRADRVNGDGERSFVNFLRNVGQTSRKDQGGGTFGYGKAAFYLASEVRTILVHTRCVVAGRPEERLIAVGLTHSYEHAHEGRTGRHWWGLLDHEGVNQPFVDEEARAWAEALGLPGFGAAEFGTTVVVLAPLFDEAALRRLPRLCLRHFWPKQVPSDGGRPPIAFRFELEGETLPLLDPSRTPPYDAMVRALQRIRTGTAETVSYGRNLVTGHVAFEIAMPSVGATKIDDELLEHERHPHHVVLLRSPELVVKYLDTARGLASDVLGFVGVFRTVDEDDVERCFALSEPPTHDDWLSTSLSDARARGIVQTSLRHVREKAKAFAKPHAVTNVPAQLTSLARISSVFAEVLLGMEAPVTSSSLANEGEGQKGSRKVRSSRPYVKVAEETEFEEHAGRAYMVFSVDVFHGRGSSRTELIANVFVVQGGGVRERIDTREEGLPTFAYWKSPNGTVSRDARANVGPRLAGRWKAYVELGDGRVAFELDVSAKRGEDEG